jgi:hypothetical protein
MKRKTANTDQLADFEAAGEPEIDLQGRIPEGPSNFSRCRAYVYLF